MGCTHNRVIGFVAIATTAVLQSGCQSVPSNGYDYSYAGRGPQGVQPATAMPYPASVQQQGVQQPVAAVNYPSMQQYQGVEANVVALKDRVERLEKALIRLDRRMQLVERNELDRMSDGSSPVGARRQTASLQKEESLARQGDEGEDERIALQETTIEPVRSAAAESFSSSEDFRMVSNNADGVIRSSLQAAPQNASITGMPSLADGGSTKRSEAATDVAVWTVSYDDPGKVWPDRAQLPASREVVQALRDSGKVTLFARGPNPNDKQFRERVKALSRYLAKVSSLESVPIAALPSPQLNAQTIEILATH